jgi:hypothetical protein
MIGPVIASSRVDAAPLEYPAAAPAAAIGALRPIG